MLGIIGDLSDKEVANSSTSQGPLNEPQNFPSIQHYAKLLLAESILGKKRHRKKLESLLAAIREHEEKIRLELLRDDPRLGRVVHWEKEIRAFQKGVNDAKKRLGIES